MAPLGGSAGATRYNLAEAATRDSAIGLLLRVAEVEPHATVPCVQAVSRDAEMLILPQLLKMVTIIWPEV